MKASILPDTEFETLVVRMFNKQNRSTLRISANSIWSRGLNKQFEGHSSRKYPITAGKKKEIKTVFDF